MIEQKIQLQKGRNGCPGSLEKYLTLEYTFSGHFLCSEESSRERRSRPVWKEFELVEWSGAAERREGGCSSQFHACLGSLPWELELPGWDGARVWPPKPWWRRRVGPFISCHQSRIISWGYRQIFHFCSTVTARNRLTFKFWQYASFNYSRCMRCAYHRQFCIECESCS